MPFPWKKVKKTSISQLVKEHVHSQRSPLMVETGFPTSLVDLFVKNRSRFKKPSKKKKPPPPPTMAHPCPPPPPSPVNLPFSPSIHRSEIRVDDEKAKNCPFVQYEQGKGDGGGVGTNRVSVAVMKMFLVVVLVLGMNNVVAGVTMSAFLLCFLEYAGESLYVGQRRVRLMIKGIWEMFRAKVVKVVVVEEDDDDCVFKAPLQHRQELLNDGCSDFSCRIQEIEVVKEEENRCEGAGVGRIVMEKGGEFKLLESKEKKSQKTKMKLKMKKLVPKKFRKKKGSALESRVNEVDDVIDGKKEIQLNSDGMVSLVASRIDDERNIVGSVEESFNGIDKMATIVQEENGVTEREHNSIYMLLLLVVLVGLIGGRIPALFFTIMCCLISKQGEGIRRYTKYPVIRSFAGMLC